ncbi:carbamate kinase [Ignatzschineria sp. LJL83]
MKKLAVVAVGGNAILNEDSKSAWNDQYQNILEASHHIADLIEDNWQVVVTHGNGPQVGHILRRSELSIQELPPEPFDYAVANTQGTIGYMFQNALSSVLQERGIHKPVASIITQTLVSDKDPAFQAPTKPIGSFMTQTIAAQRSAELGWNIMEDSGRGWRRCVASPQPLEIIELATIKELLNLGQIVIACGGGGIPVVRNSNNQLNGIDAVIDKDLVSSLLAIDLEADLLLIPTGVEKVAINFGTPEQQWLDNLSIEEALKLSENNEFGAGSMQPKVDAILSFLQEIPKGMGLITKPEAIKRALKKETGTWFMN